MRSFYTDTFKRFFDFSLALIGLAVLSPLLLLIAGIIRLSIGSPVIFRQCRPGLCCKPFVIYKFRTMKDLRDEKGRLLPDERRITPTGRVLRRTSLDELPELFNVVKGDMSLVGPRPLFMEYLERYSHEQARRHEVKPGITGWAQVNGRNAISWEEKFSYDVWYLDNSTFMVDLKILLLTFITVMKREGISQPGLETVQPFMGSK